MSTQRKSAEHWLNSCRLLVQEPLPDGVPDCSLGPFAVVVFPVIPPEGELAGIAVQVLLADAVERPIEPALEQAHEAFGRVRMSLASGVFMPRMIDAVMLAEEWPTQWNVNAGLAN